MEVELDCFQYINIKFYSLPQPKWLQPPGIGWFGSLNEMHTAAQHGLWVRPVSILENMFDQMSCPLFRQPLEKAAAI